MDRAHRPVTGKIAASLALEDTDACLAALRRLPDAVALAEIRLDWMRSFDLPRLLAGAPCPLVITFRPAREGGRFEGSEAYRLEILEQAMDLGCAYVDVEWDALDALPRRPGARVIASRHWTDGMPADLRPAWEALRARADAVKLVGLARRPADVMPVLDLLHHADRPVIALAMGAAGQVTRLLAPWFPSCLLTYGALSTAERTAPGQLALADMVDVYRLQRVGPETEVHLHLCDREDAAEAARRRNGAGDPALHVPWLLSAEDAAEVAPLLRARLPRLSIRA